MILNGHSIVDYNLVRCALCGEVECKTIAIHAGTCTTYTFIGFPVKTDIMITTRQNCNLCGIVSKVDAYQFECKVASVRCTRLYCSGCYERAFRMFEFFQNKHPVLTKLSRLDYLSTEKRNAEISKFISVEKEKIKLQLFIVREIPKDIRNVLFGNYMKIICTANRLTTEQFFM